MTQTWACSALSLNVEEPALGETEFGEVGEDRVDAVGRGLDDPAVGQNRERLDFDPGAGQFDTRNGVGDGDRVPRRHPGRGLANLLQLLIPHVHIADQDVSNSETLDHRQGLALGALADGQHGDHRSDTEDHPEHGEYRTELVCREILDRGPKGVTQSHDAPPGRMGAEGLSAASFSPASAVGSRRAMRSPSSSPSVTTTRPYAAGPSTTSVAVNSFLLQQ